MFYAIHQSRIPIVVSLCTIAFSVAIDVMLWRALGFRGAALGTSLAVLADAGALQWLPHRRQGGSHRRASRGHDRCCKVLRIREFDDAVSGAAGRLM